MTTPITKKIMPLLLVAAAMTMTLCASTTFAKLDGQLILLADSNHPFESKCNITKMNGSIIKENKTIGYTQMSNYKPKINDEMSPDENWCKNHSKYTNGVLTTRAVYTVNIYCNTTIKIKSGFNEYTSKINFGKDGIQITCGNKKTCRTAYVSTTNSYEIQCEDGQYDSTLN